MEEIILIKLGEIVLKGLNQRNFIKALLQNIKNTIEPFGKFKVYSAQSTIYVEPKEEGIDLDQVSDRISKVFGISVYSRACVCEKDMDDLLKTVNTYLKEELKAASTFKVETKRADKSFPIKSPQVSAKLGAGILKEFSNLSVDVHNPEIMVTVEIRDYAAYVRGTTKRGAGGLPVGTSGNAAILISGGIDSPVAGYMMAKRGLKLTAIHFASPPYTSQRAEQKVERLLEKVSLYGGTIKMHTVPFTEIQERMQEKCAEEYLTIIMRRFMMKISEKIAIMENCGALITGESLGQVASQTLQGLACTDEAIDMLVFRPLIGMDKDEIIDISRKIDTYETSIEPYDDCCTVFTPRRPRTNPKLRFVKLEEEKLKVDELINEAIKNMKTTYVYM